MKRFRDVARYLSLNEKKIHALIELGDILCTKVTGKRLFPKRHIDRVALGDDTGHRAAREHQRHGQP